MVASIASVVSCHPPVSQPSHRAISEGEAALLSPLLGKPDTSIHFRVRPFFSSSGGSNDLTFTAGDVTIPQILAQRTMLTGTLAGFANMPRVIGSLIEVSGTDSAGRCEHPKVVDLSQIMPGR